MNTILVTGATGNVGRPLVNLLVGCRSATCERSPEIRARAPPRRRRTGRSAVDGLAGTSAVFLNSRALGDALADTVDAARPRGVTRLVALSAINADDDFSRQPSRARGDRNKEVDELAVASGPGMGQPAAQCLRTNFAGMWAPQIRGGDVVSGPYATASTAPIAEADISAVAARALLPDDLLGRSSADRTAGAHQRRARRVIGAVLGRTLRYQEVPPELVRQRFVDIGFRRRSPTRTSPCWRRRFKPALVTHDVEKILGTPSAVVRRAFDAPRSFTD